MCDQHICELSANELASPCKVFIADLEYIGLFSGLGRGSDGPGHRGAEAHHQKNYAAALQRVILKLGKPLIGHCFTPEYITKIMRPFHRYLERI
jgi:hypothetical protein